MPIIPDPYAINDVAGNRALLFLVNPADEEAYSAFHLGVLPALNHFGVPYRLLSVADDVSLAHIASGCAGVVFGHDGVAQSLRATQVEQISDAADNGLGMLSFDGRLCDASPSVHALFGVEGLQKKSFSAVSISTSSRFITEMQDADQAHSLHIPVSGSIPSKLLPGYEALAFDGDGGALLVAGGAGEGRRAALLFSPELWLPACFGHAMGLDDLFWRSLIWIAKKPFPVFMMPPFAVCRIDDASGSHDNFGYVDTLNEHKWISNIGLFIDDIDQQGAKEIKRLHDTGVAEFSAHSFHEIGEPLPDQIYMRHEGSEYSLQELKAHFDRLDRFYERLGITPSKTVNIHYDELGINALPFLAARNQLFSMDFIPYGVAWNANSYSWMPYPYGHQSMNYTPMAPDSRFWNVMGHCLSSYKTPDAWMSPGEFMWGHTVFADESTETNIPGAINAAVQAVKVGISSGFFGTLMCHEQRIQAVTSSEWREIISGISDRLSDWEILYKGYDEIAQFAKDKARTRISSAEYEQSTDTLITQLSGICAGYLICHIYYDKEDGCVHERVNTPAFEGTHQLQI